MASNKAIIPLYLNTELLNNLFSIVVQEFVEIRSCSTRDQLIVHLKTPVSEVSYDIFGKFIQGELEFQLLSEFVKQRTEEKISAVISVLKQLRDILTQQNLLKSIDDSQSMNSIQVNDFIDFQCKLNRNPVLQHVHNMIDVMEINNIMSNYFDMDGEESADADTIGSYNNYKEAHSQILTFLKEGINSCKNGRCLRYIANDICDSDTQIVVPIKNCCMLDNEDYLLNGRIRVMGKVVKIARKSSLNGEETALGSENGSNIIYDNISLMSGTIFDNLNYQQLFPLRKGGLFRNLNLPQFDRTAIEARGNLYEILPILLYL
jgi:hypothetical protein